jgi:hypothetical protein
VLGKLTVANKFTNTSYYAFERSDEVVEWTQTSGTNYAFQGHGSFKNRVGRVQQRGLVNYRSRIVELADRRIYVCAFTRIGCFTPAIDEHINRLGQPGSRLIVKIHVPLLL